MNRENRLLIKLVAIMLGWVCLLGCVQRPHLHHPLAKLSVKELRKREMTILKAEGVRVIHQGDTLKVVIPSDQLFMPHASRLTARAKSFLLKRVAYLLSLYDMESIHVLAYTDQRSHDFAKYLTQSQASVVVRYLWSDALNASMMDAQGLGSSFPLVSHANLEAGQLNRRVVIEWRYYPLVKEYN